MIYATMQTSGLNAEEELRKYVMTFNITMIKIWRERIALLKVVDTWDVVPVNAHQRYANGQQGC